MIEALGGDGAHSGAAQGGLRGLPIANGLEAIGNGRIAVMGGWREENSAEKWRRILK